MKSPLTGNHCTLVDQIPTSKLNFEYQKYWNFDVTDFFKEIKCVDVYLCPDSGYLFFCPFEIAANEKFYDFFQQYDWYYVKDRWEIAETGRILEPGMKVLDVGCGEGIALSSFSGKGCICTGIEINEKARNKACAKGLHVIGDKIEKHSAGQSRFYDVVCSYHVLEHMSDDVKHFIQCCVDCVKPGGYLVFSVPNNDGFAPKYTVLNYPPHHMGLWNSKSLSYLARIFPLEDYKTLYSPLLKEQVPDFNIFAANEIGKKMPIIRSLSRMPFTYSLFFGKKTKAYTILKIFRKY